MLTRAFRAARGTDMRTTLYAILIQDLKRVFPSSYRQPSTSPIRINCYYRLHIIISISFLRRYQPNKIAARPGSQIQAQHGALIRNSTSDYDRDLKIADNYAAFSSSGGAGTGRLGGDIDLIART